MIYLSSSMLWDDPMADVLRSAAELGYQGVEVWAEQWRQQEPHVNDAADVRRIAAELGLGLSVHASSWDLNMCALNAGIRAQSRVELAGSLNLAHELGATVLVVHPGRVTISAEDLPRHWEWLIDAVAWLDRHAGGTGVTVAIEQMERIPREFVVTPEDMQRLHAGVGSPTLGTTFDLAHVPAELDVLTYWRNLPNVVHLHLSDALDNRLHLPLGEGNRGLPEALRVIWPEFHGAITIEGYERRGQRGLATRNKRVYDEWLAARALPATAGTPAVA